MNDRDDRDARGGRDEDRRGTAAGADPAAAEDELRVLLERAVPQLPAPAQRLESVRERVRRRRRRRAAGTSITAVLAVAMAGLLLPGLGDRDGGPPPLATSSLAPPASGSAAGPSTASPPTPTAPTTAPPSVPPGYALEPFDNLSGLLLVLPPGWSALSDPGSPRAYVATQSLGLPKGGCAHQLDDFCTPLDRTLQKDGVLVQFSLTYDTPLAEKLRGRGAGPAPGPEAVYTACRTVGGTEQLSRSIVDATGSPVVVRATACMAHPRGPQEARVRALLTSASFS